MIDVLKIMLFTSFLGLGWMGSIQSGLINEKIGDWFAGKAERYKIFQVFICPWCCPTLFSWVAFLILVMMGELGFHIKYLYAYPVVVGGCSIFNGIVLTVYQLIVEKLNVFRSNADG